jgi:hypothetical protein
LGEQESSTNLLNLPLCILMENWQNDPFQEFYDGNLMLTADLDRQLPCSVNSTNEIVDTADLTVGVA